ncbi:putative extracellular sulfatase Sulf-1 homolog [Physella acuta]|uniref:putative extracellular sulfatase Sulf-1 homolog n=1 Tax=Physella acuta TaxID=109671 RepID=UPI0027DBDF66|nr:putative extracellular sulfatase Sulf-1 homolog [Physella acuta]
MATPGSNPPRLALLLATLLLLVAMAESNGTDARESRRHRNTKPRNHIKEPQPTQHSQDSLPSFTKNASKLPPRAQHKPSGRKPRSEKPNIVFILTDDQDVLLGSLKYMPKVQTHLIRAGVYFNNSFVPTPMCCPSRSSLLTGMYVHNHNTYTNNDNCSSLEWQKFHEPHAFPTYMNETYSTGYFGKYLNEYDGNHVPPGWQRWLGLIKNTRYYNYSVVDENLVKRRHSDNYYADYFTDLIANESRAFLHESKKRFPSKPVMMVLSLPAPHGPEDAAPQYQHMFNNNTDHRTPAWNYAPNPDKQWLLQNVYPMIPQYKIFTDLLQRRRLQTLQSVDDLVESIVEELAMLEELDNTYIVYTSDHGYHLGQFGLIKGKAMPFDFDTRVPLIIRGPDIHPGTIISNIVTNIDIAPTLIEMAGGTVPEHMDGESFLKLIKTAKDQSNVDNRGFVSTQPPWRDTILFERGKLTEKMLKQKMKEEEMTILNQQGSSKQMHYYISAAARKQNADCEKKEFQPPCKPQQKWYCMEQDGVLKKLKCRHNKTNDSSAVLKDQPQPTQPMTYTCPCRSRRHRKQNRLERQQKEFRKRHIRDKRMNKLQRYRRNLETSVALAPLFNGTFPGFEAMLNRRCRILSNQSVTCDLDIYQKASEWESHKETVDTMIKEYRKALEDLRDIRRHLREQKPQDAIDHEEEEDVSFDFKDHEFCVCDEMGNVIETRRGKKIDSNLTLQEEKILNQEERKRLRRMRRKRKQSNFCNMKSMNCFTHDNEHWKTPPYWNYGPFCFCANANNNTYWCLRTINQTHDFLYCEFITSFMSFYDLKKDPHQLKNVVTELNYGIIQQLHDQLKKLKHCKTSKDCYIRSNQKNRFPHDPDWSGREYLKNAAKSKVVQPIEDDYLDDDLEEEYYYTDNNNGRQATTVKQDNDYE